MPTCNTDTCVGLSSGTAGLFISDTTKSSSSSLLSTGNFKMQFIHMHKFKNKNENMLS